MPCESGESSYQDAVRNDAAIRAERRKTRELMALLCAACTAWGHSMPASVAAWWVQHQKRDARRSSAAAQKAAASRRARTVAITRLERQRSQIDAELATLRKARGR
jgi:hypothetical protein